MLIRYNGYTLSSDFPDGRTRIRLDDIIERVNLAPADTPDRVGLLGDDGPILAAVDGKRWLTELQAYGLLMTIRSRTRQLPAEKLLAAASAFFETIKAFCDYRSGSPGNKRLTPHALDMFRTDPLDRDGYEVSEAGSIVLMLSAFTSGELPTPPAEALGRIVSDFAAVRRSMARAQTSKRKAPAN